jgi:hypothetical protein
MWNEGVVVLMQVSWDGPLPQVELGPHLGGAKTLFMRSGIVTRMITMLSAMSAAWSTSHTLRSLFAGSYFLFVGAALLVMGGWMVFDYVLILPSEQSFRQGQAHREERSPLKRDHDEMMQRLEALDDD